MNCFLCSVLRNFLNILLLSKTNLKHVQCAYHCLHSSFHCMFIYRKQSLLLDEVANTCAFVVVLIGTSFLIFWYIYAPYLRQTPSVNM